MTYPIYRALLLVLVVAALAALVFWIAARPSRPSTRLGMRGLKRQRSLVRSAVWAGVEPFVRWMGLRVSVLLTPRAHASLDRQLVHAGDVLGLTPEEYVAIMVACATIGVAVGAALGSVLGVRFGWLPVPLGAAVFGFAPYMIVDNARVERLKAINRGLPYAIDLMALSMSAGLDFPGSVQQVVEKAKANESLREELAYLLQQLQLGHTRGQALRELAARAPLDAMTEFVQALLQAEERGNPVAAVLEVQASTSRARRTELAERAATDMRAKMVLPTMMLIGVGLMLIAAPAGMMMEKLAGGAK